MIIKKLIITSTVGAGLGDKEGLAIVDLDLSLVAEVREKLPPAQESPRGYLRRQWGGG